MTDEERQKVKDMIAQRKKQKEDKKMKKAGMLNVEIIVAIVIFVFFFIIAVYTRANYTNNIAMYKRKVDATGICLNVLNEEKAKEFSEIISRTASETVDGITYNYSVNISNKLKDTEQEYDNVKNINVVVDYTVEGDTYNVSLDALKVVPIYEI